jgi:hypothetical protein
MGWALAQKGLSLRLVDSNIRALCNIAPRNNPNRSQKPHWALVPDALQTGHKVSRLGAQARRFTFGGRAHVDETHRFFARLQLKQGTHVR